MCSSVGQVALSMVLLVTAGLLLDAFRKSQATSPGYQTEERLMLTLDTSQVRYTPERTREFYRQLRDGAVTLPGVRSATLTSWLPLDRGGETSDVVPEGTRWRADERRVRTLTAVVDDGFFGTMQVPLQQGRPFNYRGRRGGTPGGDRQRGVRGTLLAGPAGRRPPAPPGYRADAAAARRRRRGGDRALSQHHRAARRRSSSSPTHSIRVPE